MKLSVVLFLYFLFQSLNASATLLDFESLSDLDSVTNQYTSQGISFNNTVALTAGFSLNEFDFPPHSGQVVVGDDNAPIEIGFVAPTSNISAWFTYSDSLTITAYDASNALLGTVLSSGLSNFGSSEQIALGFNNVSRLVIAGNTNNSFIMDDLSFTSTASPIPEPATLMLMGIGLFGMGYRKFASCRKC